MTSTEQQTSTENVEERGAELALTRGMSVEMLEEDLPALRAGLEAGIRAAAAVLREERGRVVAAEDTFDLIRRLVHAQDVLTRTATAYSDAAKVAAQEIAEELSAAVGEQDGVPMGRLVVPAGDYEYVIKPVFASGADTWDMASLLGVLAELAEEGQPLPEGVAHLEALTPVLREWAREIAADALTRFAGLLSSPKLKATAVDALRRKVAAAGDDQRAAVLGQCRVRGGQTYRETVSVDVEEPKDRRR
jgi:hypothetical protein